MAHSAIASTAEPWLLLPLFYMLRRNGISSEYGHPTAVDAYRRISREVSNIDSAYDRIRTFAESVYQSDGKVTTYFLDKTPRYYFILDDLYHCFPEAKFIVLLRNPVSVFSSAVDAFLNNRLRRLDHLDCDFHIGPDKISSFVFAHRDELCIVKYEDLISQPELHIQRICEYLNLDYEEDMIKNSFNIILDGPGDALGARQYKRVRHKDAKWESIINTRIRKTRVIRHLRRFSSDYLQAGNYNLSELIEQVSRHQTRNIEFIELIYLVEELGIRAIKASIGRLAGKSRPHLNIF